MSPSAPQPATPQIKIRKLRAGLVFGAGLAVTGTPFLLSWCRGSQFGTTSALASSTLTNVGTAIALAVVLYLLERSFTRHVSGVVAAQVKVETETQTRELREETANLRNEVDDLAREFADNLSKIAADRDAAVEAVRTAPSFEAVTGLLERATDIQALRRDNVLFPADNGLDAPRFTIFWGPPENHSSLWSHQSQDSGPPALVIAYQVPAESRQGGWTPAEVRWRDGQRPAVLLTELTETLRSAGHQEAAKRIGPHFFDSLAPAIEAAIAGREGRDGSWMRGRLEEWLTDGWAVTDAGLESREGHFVPAKEFPDIGAMSAEAKSNLPRWEKPPAPAGVDQDFWDFAIGRAREVHYSSSNIFDIINGVSGYTSESSPRGR